MKGVRTTSMVMALMLALSTPPLTGEWSWMFGVERLLCLSGIFLFCWLALESKWTK